MTAATDPDNQPEPAGGTERVDLAFAIPEPAESSLVDMVHRPEDPDRAAEFDAALRRGLG